MNKTFQILHLNARKQSTAQQSLMNDDQLKGFAAIAIAEPYARRLDSGTIITAPMGHANWTKMLPTTQKNSRWPVRSMMWIRKDLESEQIPVQSSDITAALIRVHTRRILIVAVYVQGSEAEALRTAIEHLRSLLRHNSVSAGTPVDVLITGGFNRHDQLWVERISPRIGKEKQARS
jgi:hypothetical protein